MSVEFDEDEGIPTRRSIRPHREPALTRLVIKSHLAKTAKGAEALLLFVGLASMAGALFIFLDLGGVKPPPSPVPTAQWP